MYTLLPFGHPVRTLDWRPSQYWVRIAVSHPDGTGSYQISHPTNQLMLSNIIPSIYPLVVKGSGGRDGEIIALVPVPLCVYPVQGKGHDCQHIGCYGGPGPGGIYFAGCHIFYVVPVAHNSPWPYCPLAPRHGPPRSEALPPG